jgi:hypothetical protein
MSNAYSSRDLEVPRVVRQMDVIGEAPPRYSSFDYRAEKGSRSEHGGLEAQGDGNGTWQTAQWVNDLDMDRGETFNQELAGSARVANDVVGDKSEDEDTSATLGSEMGKGFVMTA